MGRPSKYTPELRRRAVEEVLDRDRKIVEVAASLGITTPETLRKWVNQARIDRGLVVGPTTVELAEIKALRKEVADQQRTIEILKAATTFFVQEATRARGDDHVHGRSSASVPGGGDVLGVGVLGADLLRIQGPGPVGAGCG